MLLSIDFSTILLCHPCFSPPSRLAPTRVLVFLPLQTLEINGEVTVRSDTVLDTTGVRFVVHPQGSLTVAAPAITMSRPEVSEHAAVQGLNAAGVTRQDPNRPEHKMRWPSRRVSLLADNQPTVFHGLIFGSLSLPLLVSFIRASRACLCSPSTEG